ncbi:MAG: T9SS type A sorting domain-containing protein, partial [Bacteroidales bacterium]|nr:T9SS type A sorting domain-containing protein [Bacteroidales bacterium]
KASGAPSGVYTGIRIAETQATDQVYKNTFTGLSYGNYAVGKNWNSTHTDQGLAYYCNLNTGNHADFTVEDVQDQDDGIQDPQGSELMPAGNTFSPYATYHFNNWNYNDWIGYYYFAPSPGNINTVYYPEYINRVTREPVVGIQNTCPSHYGGSGGGSSEGRSLVLTPEERQDAELEFADNLSDYNNVKILYDNLRDGGNTEATITDIETAWPNDMWELRAELLGKSPHLSLDVLKAMADKTDVLPDNVIFEILAANPDELKKEELIKYLEDKENPLPGYMIDILKQVAGGSTYKTVLIRHMAHYNQVKTSAAHDIVRSILNDSVVDNNELRNWLDNIGGKHADEQIIASYLSEGNYSDATALANMMPALYDYSDDEMAEHNYFMDMLNLQISLQYGQRTIFDFDSTEVSNLVYIAETSSGTAGVQAKGILEYAYGYQYCNCINADSSGYKSSSMPNPDSFEQLLGIEIRVEPNPAKEWAAFNFTLPDSESEGVIQINNAEGKLVETLSISGKQGQEIWNTSIVKPGVYFYTLNVSGFNKSGKIIVSK